MSTEDLIDFSTPNYNLTETDIIEVIKKIHGSSFKNLVNYQLSDYSNSKNGFVALHRRLDVQFSVTGDDKIKELNFFVKSKPNVYTEGSKFQSVDEVTKEETTFYSIILPKMLENFDIDQFSPNCYLVKDDLMVMEDLKNRNFCMGDKPLKLTQIKAALCTLARFHASSILLENYLGKSLDQAFPESFKEKIIKGKESYWYEFSLKSTNALAEKFGLADSEKCTNIMDKMLELIKPSKKHRNVICHSDVWANNLMFDDKENCILIDYQGLRYSPLVNDLLQLLYVNVESNYRKKSEMELLKYYYSILTEIIKKNNSNVILPTFNDIIEAYNELRIFGKILLMLYLPGMYLFDELLKDSSSIINLEEFHNDMIKHVDANENYRNIMKMAVEEFLNIDDIKV